MANRNQIYTTEFEAFLQKFFANKNLVQEIGGHVIYQGLCTASQQYIKKGRTQEEKLVEFFLLLVKDLFDLQEEKRNTLAYYIVFANAEFPDFREYGVNDFLQVALSNFCVRAVLYKAFVEFEQNQCQTTELISYKFLSRVNPLEI